MDTNVKLGVNFEVLLTSDGSPTLNSQYSGESMHNRNGAFSETIAIYGPAISNCLEQIQAPKILSVGLGIGYNEILSAALSLKLKNTNIYIESLEYETELIECFKYWITQTKSSKLDATYNQVLQLTSEQLDIPAEHIKERLKSLYESNLLKLNGPLSASYKPEQKFNCILYDAYSSQTSPDLWQEDFLNTLWSKLCAEDCLIATYAAKGVLKRSLIASQFAVLTPPGFGGKRQSTLAHRGALKV